MSFRTFYKILTLSVMLALAPMAWIPMIWWKISQLYAAGEFDSVIIIYAMSAILGVISFIIMPFLRNNILRYIICTIFMLSFCVERTLSSIIGAPTSVMMFQTIFQNTAEADHAWGTYHYDIILGCLTFVAFIPGVLIRPSLKVSVRSIFVVVPALAVVLTYQLQDKFARIADETPSPIALPIKAVLGYGETKVYLGRRDAVSYEGSLLAGSFEKIVFIVDESIRGDYLQFNDDNFNNTPFLSSISNSFANFGVASSYANCSAQSRMSLRSGARDTDYPDPQQHVLHQPTFWQYAKYAGYRTVYLDGWLARRPMHSFLTYDELGYIDDRVGADLSPYPDADNHIAEQIKAMLERPGKEFIFVEKIGLHTPYELAVPSSLEYTPTYGRKKFDYLTSDQRKVIDEYSRGILIRVDNFFKILSPYLNDPKTLIIYTSDHGQSMFEGGYEATHCSGRNAVRGEGLVPLMVFTGDSVSLGKFRAAAHQFYNRAAHSDIFPTLLTAMGFDPEKVQPAYRPGLLDIDPNRHRQFFVGTPFRRQLDTIQVDDPLPGS